MGKPIRLGVVFGGRSGEHEVSFVSARSVLNTLDPQKYHITQIGITIDGDWLVGEKTLETLSEKNIDQLWKEEIDLRVKSIESDKIVLVDGKKVFQKIKDRFANEL